MAIEKKRRSVFKAISWRVVATLTTMLVVYACTGELGLTFAIGGLDVVLKMMLYYFHERTWNKIRWGKVYTKPFVLWFTGLSGSGKSTLSEAVAKRLDDWNVNYEPLDGDAIRNIFPKTGFSKEERNMHIRRAGYLAGLLERRGVAVIGAFISPYKEARDFVRESTQNFIEVHVSTPLEVCEERDPKGLYKKVRAGEIKQFTGVNDPYEPPESPEIRLDTSQFSVEDCTDKIFEYLKKNGFVK